MRKVRREAMRKVWILGVLLAMTVVGTAMSWADSPQEKYAKYMEKYHKHMREAQEEYLEGDMDDYRKELAKAQEALAKAQAYASSGFYAPVPQPPISGYHGNYYAKPRTDWSQVIGMGLQLGLGVAREFGHRRYYGHSYGYYDGYRGYYRPGYYGGSGAVYNDRFPHPIEAHYGHGYIYHGGKGFDEGYYPFPHKHYYGPHP